jgi:predicted enzyme related to lactoylglutathione lyase
MTEYKPGTFCWPELVAASSDRAKDFYSNLFGWSIEDVPIGSDRVYSMASVKGRR